MDSCQPQQPMDMCLKKHFGFSLNQSVEQILKGNDSLLFRLNNISDEQFPDTIS